MHFQHLSEFPIIRAGRVRDEDYDYDHAMNNNVIWFNGRYYVYWKGVKALPETDHDNPTYTMLGFIDPDAYDETGAAVRTPFNGRNLIRYAGNPVVDFGTGSWTAPLDIYTNPALIEEGNIANVGAVVFQNKVHLYYNVYDYNDENTNRVALLTSTDGINFTEVGEILYGGGPFGKTIGPLFVHDSKLWTLCGVPKVLRSSTDGVNWTDHGTAISLSSDPASIYYSGLIVGKGIVHGDYAYAFIPGSRIDTDWPEGICLWRTPLATLGTTSLAWEEYPNNPVLIRDPTKGAVWQLNPFQVGSEWYALSNAWGKVGFDNINTTDMNGLRTTQYYGLAGDDVGWKHCCVSKALNTLAFDNWDLVPITNNGIYQLRIGGKYLAVENSTPVNQDPVVLSEDVTSQTTHWKLTKESGFYLIRPYLNQTLAIDMQGGSDLRARKMALEVSTYDTVDATNNLRFHWCPLYIGNTLTKQMYLTNRQTSLGITKDAVQDVCLCGSSDIITFIEV